MTQRILLGMLTPSSNTTLEPVTAAMLEDLPEASAHFGRFRVTEIALSQQALSQFDDSEILAAAELLSHAKLDVIGWNGTSSGWLGFDADERLCERITARTGIAACTSVLALNEIFTMTGVCRFGLVTPYLDDVQSRIIANYAASGFECVSERHLGKQDNFSFSEVGADDIRRMAREVAEAKPDAIVSPSGSCTAMVHHSSSRSSSGRQKPRSASNSYTKARISCLTLTFSKALRYPSATDAK